MANFMQVYKGALDLFVGLENLIWVRFCTGIWLWIRSVQLVAEIRVWFSSIDVLCPTNQVG